jgi:chromosome partitioning protein
VKHSEESLAGASSVIESPLARELTDLTNRRKKLADAVPALPAYTRILTVSNQKGGVGKTTTTVNLAAALARLGARVLVIDLDPQGNASTALGIEHHEGIPGIYDVLIGDAKLSDVIQASPEEGELLCAPSNINLAGAEIELVDAERREYILRAAIHVLLTESDTPFHYVFIDCPPSLGLLTLNAFVAAREVLIPIQCEYYALEGLSQLLKTIERVSANTNPNLRVSTILLTMFDARTRLANEVADDVRTHFPHLVLSSVIPRAVRVSEAPSYGQTVVSYDPASVGAISYFEAAVEIAQRGAIEAQQGAR